jgi:hypothetical protein
MKANEETIATWEGYAIVRTKPTFGGRPFYWVGIKHGDEVRIITRTFSTKKLATRALKRVQALQPYPILDSRIQWLKEGIEKFGHSGL